MPKLGRLEMLLPGSVLEGRYEQNNKEYINRDCDRIHNRKTVGSHELTHVTVEAGVPSLTLADVPID